MRPQPILDVSQLDTTNIIADKEAIRAVIPQRFEMEQLDAIIYEDREKRIIAGFKDVKISEFWVRGHMPDYPLLPGVLMCEAAAQLCSFYMTQHGSMKGDFISLGGIDNVRFRSPVVPGDRLILVGHAPKLHPRRTTVQIQGFVGETMVFHGEIIGISFSTKKG